LGLENGHFWAKLHLYSTERQETAGSSVFHSGSVQGGLKLKLRKNSFLTNENRWSGSPDPLKTRIRPFLKNFGVLAKRVFSKTRSTLL
jgi:hypothetical protein